MTLTRCMYDLYHGDYLNASSYAEDAVLFGEATAAGWPMMIHKLTQGTDFVDNLAFGRLQAAHRANVLLGVYHFMTLDPAASQAAFFMHAVGQLRMIIDAPLLLVIDNEPLNANIASDNLVDGVVAAVKAVSGKYPLLYGPRNGLWSPSSAQHLLACPYWLAEYGTNPVPPVGYGKFPSTQVPFHQYSDGTQGPNPVNIPGIGFVDQSEFNGTLGDLASWFEVHAT